MGIFHVLSSAGEHTVCRRFKLSSSRSRRAESSWQDIPMGRRGSGKSEALGLPQIANVPNQVRREARLMALGVGLNSSALIDYDALRFGRL